MDMKLGRKPGRCAQQLNDINAASTEVAQDPVDTPQLTPKPAKKQKSTKNVTSAPKPTGRILALIPYLTLMNSH
jgi:hypothetical protein